MEEDAQKNGYYYPGSGKSGSLTGSCISAVLAVMSFVVIPLIGFFVALIFLAIAIGFWRRYLSGLSMTQSANQIDRAA